jgi:uncharacterized protein (TIGR00255 family)
MIKSMTGYAVAEESEGEMAVMVDIRSYNSRHLDVILRIPPSYIGLEEKIKGLISENIIRGRVETKIQIKKLPEDAVSFEIDRSRAKAIRDALTQLKDEFDFQTEISLDLLLSMGGVLKPVEMLGELDSCWPILKRCLTQSLDDLDRMRKKEGDFIARDLARRLDFIQGCVRQIEADSNNLLYQYQKRLMERISALTRESVEIEPGRIAQEAAFLADRSDISEEIVRIESHLEQFRHIMDSTEPGGRKLNFMLQELHREINTIGSKVGKADIAHRVVEVKSELEKIREQIQNVE